MLYQIPFTLTLAVLTINCNAQPSYWFSYFKENGLHIAASKNGYTRTAHKNDSSFLTPSAKKWLVYFDKYTHHQMGAIASIDPQNWRT